MSYFPSLHLWFYCHCGLLFGIDCSEKKNGANSLSITFDTVITVAENEKKKKEQNWQTNAEKKCSPWTMMIL